MAKKLTNPNQRKYSETGQEEFTQVKNKRRGKGGGSTKTRKGQVGKDPRSVNPFEALEEKGGDGGTAEGKEDQEKLSEQITEMEKEEELQVPIEGMEENEVEEMGLGELDLDAIEAECGKKGKGYVSKRKLELLQEEIIISGAHQDLGIEPDPQKGSKRKTPEDELLRGRKKTNNI